MHNHRNIATCRVRQAYSRRRTIEFLPLVSRPSSLAPRFSPLAPRPSSFASPLAFTLVEMLVAMALAVFVMLILSQCFVQGLETFSGLKAVGDMQAELRTAATLLRADLSADHFEGKRRLSDPPIVFMRIDNKVREGFFVLGQGVPDPNVYSMKVQDYPGSGYSSPGGREAYEQFNPADKTMQVDPDAIGSYHVTDHWLHFSIKQRGNAREKLFAAPASFMINQPVTDYLNNTTTTSDAVFQEISAAGATPFVRSHWAEVAYFLLPTGSTANTSVWPPLGGTPLYALYRVQYVVLPNPAPVNASYSSATSSPFNYNIASITGRFLSPNDLASGYQMRTFYPYGPYQSDRVAIAFGGPLFQQVFLPSRLPNDRLMKTATVALSNVVSFQVEVLKNPTFTGDFEDLNLVNSTANTVPFDTANYQSPAAGQPLPGPPYKNSVAAVPVDARGNFSIQALQIIIRIWDPKTRQTRQTTIIQDM